MHLGTPEIILIVVLALIIFGGGKVAGVGKALGQSIHDFKKSLKDDSSEKEEKSEVKSAENTENK